MSNNADHPTFPYHVEIQSDRMLVQLRAGKSVGKVTREAVLEALKAQKILINPTVEAAVDQLVARETPPKNNELIVVAQGIAPVHAIPPRVEAVMPETPEGTGRDRSTIPSVVTGAIVGKVIEAIPGKDGIDIHGQPVPHRPAKQEIVLGANVEFSPDRTTVIAKMSGLLQVKHGKLSVETAMEVAGNLDFATGNVNFTGSVLIRGNVADLFKVIASEDIYVGGAVEAADIHGGHNVEVHGGICCRDKGKVVAGNDLRAKFISNTTIETGNDVIVHSEISNARVMAKGKVHVESGAIYTSHITAAGGVLAASLGSPAHAKTLVECGLDAALRKNAAEKLPEIQASFKRVAKVREVITPLLAHQKNLTAAQKEKATEMLFEADELQHQADATIKEIASDYNRYSKLAQTAEVIVSGTIYPGVTIRFPGMETTLRMPIKGPVRIQVRDVHGSKMIVAYNENTKQAQQLELRGTEDEVMAELVKTLNEGKHLHDTDPTHAHPAATSPAASPAAQATTQHPPVAA